MQSCSTTVAWNNVALWTGPSICADGSPVHTLLWIAIKNDAVFLWHRSAPRDATDYVPHTRDYADCSLSLTHPKRVGVRLRCVDLIDEAKGEKFVSASI